MRTAEQAIPKLREAEVALATGKTVAAACKRIGVTEQTRCRWRKEYGRPEDRPGQEVEGSGAGERPAEAAARGGRSGQGDPEGGRLGKRLSPAKRRRAVGHVREALGHERVSERRVCRVLGQARSTQRRAPRVPDDEPALVKRLVGLATRYGRYGYRRIGEPLRREGWHVNQKRVERLWRREGLKAPKRQPKRRRLWLKDGSCVRPRPTHRNHVRSYGFVQDRTHDGRAFQMRCVIDEFTRECLAIEVARRLASEDVLERLSDLFVRSGVPELLRSDNGSEFTARALWDWLGRVGVRTLFYRAGQPVGERRLRVVQRQASGRAAGAGGVRPPARGEGADRTLAGGVQPRPAAQIARRPPSRTGGGRAGEPRQHARTNIGSGTITGGRSNDGNWQGWGGQGDPVGQGHETGGISRLRTFLTSGQAGRHFRRLA